MEEMQVDVAVVGGGPAGMAAAVAARAAGASVVLIDEYAAPGGQIWRRRYDEVGDVAPASLPPAARERVRAFAGSGAELLAGTSVWGSPEPGVLLLTGSALAGPGEGRWCSPPAPTTAPSPFRAGRCRGCSPPAARRRSPRARASCPAVACCWPAPARSCSPSRRSSEAGGAGSCGGRGSDAAARLAARRTADGGVSRPARRLRPLPHEGAERIAWGHVIVRAEGDGEVRSATIAEAGADWAPPAASGPSRSMPSARPTASPPPSSSPARSAASCAATASSTTRTCATTVPGVFVAGEASGIGGADLAQVEGELAGCTGSLALTQRGRATARGAGELVRAPTRTRPRRAAAAPREARGLRGDPLRPLRPASRPARPARRTPSCAAARTSPPARSTAPSPAARRRWRR